jgi:cytochrome c oxidase subunit 2
MMGELMEPRRRLQDWHHMLIMFLVMVVMSEGLAYLFLHVDIIPFPSSIERGYIDNFVKLLLSIASVFFSIVVVVLAYSLLFFRRRKGDTSDGPTIRSNPFLERTWTIIPLVIVLSLAAYGAVVLDKMTAPGPPQTELEIDVLAFRYGWQFSYPEYDVTSFELHVPVNQRILIKLQSKDVVHSFWVQEWGPKQDAVPGITTQVRYTPTIMGQFTVRCSQLCGYGHSFMTAPVFVTSLADFQSWIQQQQQKSKPTPTPTPTPTPSTTAPSITFQSLATAGKTIYSNNCASCHGENGEGGVGPALWGSNATLGTYSGVTLFNNDAQEMLNFISTKMPLSAPGSLSHEQYIDVLSYILVQDKQVSPSSAFDESQLGSITLK